VLSSFYFNAYIFTLLIGFEL